MRRYFYTSAFLILLFSGLPVATVNAEMGKLVQAVLFTLKTSSVSDEITDYNSYLLYITDPKDNSLSFYKIESDAISSAINVSLKNLNNEWWLTFKQIYSDQEKTETIKIEFKDNDSSISIRGNNGTEHYVLYPSFYTIFKKNVQHENSALAVLSFLEDNIGGNLSNDIYPWLWSGNHQNRHKQIKSGYVVTKRSQADDVEDNWNVKYDYKEDESLTLINATSKDQTHFKKKINYSGTSITSTEIFQNLEDRQITERTIIYKDGLPSSWTDHIVETGKKRETDFNTKFSRKNITIDTTVLSEEEVLKLAHDI